MPEIYVGLGSNLGDKEGNIRQALARLGERSEIVRVSPLYQTDPVGYCQQDWFLNGVAHAKTALDPRSVLRLLQSIEASLGRAQTVPNGPRTIDLDLLLYDDLVVGEPGLTVPHPRLHERLFVLAPLSELCPRMVHPLLRRTVEELRTSLKNPESVTLYRAARSRGQRTL